MKRIAALLAILALVTAACGGGDSADDGIATLDDGDGLVTTTTEARLGGEEALLLFSECMRDEGIPLPDIGVDSDGAPLLDPSLLDVIDIESAEFESAFDECQPILSQSQAFNIDLDPELQAQIADQLFVFSQCMRDNGFGDFPDPSLLETGQPYPLSVLTQFSDPDFEAAVEICQRDLAFGN
ncbi:MAG: hypothetical protein GY720_11865 [bacterium]|nr:hypothetical protein [bacterium]